MPLNDIQVGHFYIKKNGALVREIKREMPEGDVMWRDYGYSDGKPIGSGCCSKDYMTVWAERELTQSEIDKLQIEEADALDKAQNATYVQVALRSATTEELIAELLRRGAELGI